MSISGIGFGAVTDWRKTDVNGGLSPEKMSAVPASSRAMESGGNTASSPAASNVSGYESSEPKKKHTLRNLTLLTLALAGAGYGIGKIKKAPDFMKKYTAKIDEYAKKSKDWVVKLFGGKNKAGKTASESASETSKPAKPSSEIIKQVRTDITNAFKAEKPEEAIKELLKSKRNKTAIRTELEAQLLRKGKSALPEEKQNAIRQALEEIPAPKGFKSRLQTPPAEIPASGTDELIDLTKIADERFTKPIRKEELSAARKGLSEVTDVEELRNGIKFSEAVLAEGIQRGLKLHQRNEFAVNKKLAEKRLAELTAPAS